MSRGKPPIMQKLNMCLRGALREVSSLEAPRSGPFERKLNAIRGPAAIPSSSSRAYNAAGGDV